MTNNETTEAQEPRPEQSTSCVGDLPYPAMPQLSLSCLLDEPSVESEIGRFYLDILRVAEVVPHLGLPVRGHSHRHALPITKVSPGAMGLIPALMGPILGVSEPGQGGGKI